MNKRLKDIIDIKNQPDQIYIQDRSIFEDRYMFVPTLYNQGHLNTREYENYTDLYKSISKLIGFPDLLIYIRSSIGNLTTQIAKRGRSSEANISINYLQTLNEQYENFVNNYKGNMIIIDGDSIKFENNENDFKYVTDLIDTKLKDLK
jgi:deoxyadenosine/deoxycytidine kinase